MDNANGVRGMARALTVLALSWALLTVGCSKPLDDKAAPEARPQAAEATPAGKSDAAPTPDAKSQEKAREAAKAQERVVAHTRNGDITLGDINNYAKTGLCTPLVEDGLSTDTAETLKGPKLEATVKWIGSRMAAVAEVDTKKDPSLNKFLEANLQPQLDTVLFAHMMRTEIMDLSKPPSPEEVAAYYEKTKAMFFQPFSFTFQWLMLQTYEPYIVQPGDTLEGIAKLISGDEKAVDNIRADLPGRPLRRDPAKLFKPLVPGEALLVPMNAKRTEEVRMRLEAMMRDVRNTTDTHERQLKFGALARKYDESGLKGAVTTPLPTGTRKDKAPMTEIVDVVKQTPVGEISKVFRTKHGYQALLLVDRVDEHTLPLSQPEVKQMIVDKLKVERKEKAAEDLVATLMEKPELKIDYNLVAEGNKLTTDTVVATIGEEKLLWRDVKDAWVGGGSPRDEVHMRKVMSHCQPLVAMLIRHHLKPLLEDPKNELARQIKVMRTAYLGSAYITKLAAEETAKQVTKDKAKEYYEKHKDELYKTPARVSYEAACWPLEIQQQGLKDTELQQALEKAAQSLGEALRNVKTPEDWTALKSQLDQKMAAQGREPIKADNTPLEGLSPQAQEALSKLQPGQWSGPVVTSDQSGVMSLMLKQLIPPGHETFEQAIDKANRDLFNMQIAAAIKRFEDEFTQRAGVELLVK